MGAIQLALRTATKSNNSDLIMMAALALYDKCARREGVRRRDAPEVPSSLLDLMSHFPLVFNSWLFYLEQTDPNRLLALPYRVCFALNSPALLAVFCQLKGLREPST